MRSDLYQSASAQWRNPIAFLYPSSVAVQEHTRDLLEYAAAKAAGEALCNSLGGHPSRNRIHVVRLPMLATEMSRGLLEADPADAAEVMLPILRNMGSDNPSE